MARNSKTAERVKDSVEGLVKKTRVAVNQGLDVTQKSFDARVDRLDRRYRQAMSQLLGRTDRLSKNVHEQLGQARKRVSRLQREARKYAKDHPGKVLATAAGLGLLVGLAASPRRHLGAAKSV